MLVMIGMPPATEASNAIDRPEFASPIEQLRSMFGQQRLVRRDDVFAAFQHPQHDRSFGLQPADELRDDLDFSVVDDVVDLVGEHALRQIAVAGLL